MKQKKDIKEQNPLRYLARFKVTAACPLGVGSGKKGTITDRLVARDAVGLPYIPGSSLAGVIRHELEDREDAPFAKAVEQLFGYQEDPSKKNNNQTAEGQGSRIHFSSALLVADDFSTVHEGLAVPDFNADYYSILQDYRLAERDHVRLTHRGVAAERAKYEEELVPKGTAFYFQIELLGTEEDQAIWEHILNLLHQSTFRVGAGTRKGFGQLKVETCQTATYHLKEQTQLLAYLQLSSTYNTDLDKTYWSDFIPTTMSSTHWLEYVLNIQAKDFFHFGAGIGDKEVNHAPKTEHLIEWKNGTPVLKKNQYLIPATSLKGAIAHRVAYHYNNQAGEQRVTVENITQKALTTIAESVEQQALTAANQVNFEYQAAAIDWPADDIRWENLLRDVERLHCEHTEEWKTLNADLEQQVNTALQQPAQQYVGEANYAVQTLFGCAKDSEKETGARGKVLFSDFYLEEDKVETKIFNHVKIDRFTGGGIDGALFIEKVTHTKENLKFVLQVEKEVLEDAAIKAAFETTLKEITIGQLPLGGSTAKGHGIFMDCKEVKSKIEQ